jgi:hypothetical protein
MFGVFDPAIGPTVIAEPSQICHLAALGVADPEI